MEAEAEAAQKIRIEKVLPHPTLMGPMGISAKSPSFPGRCCASALTSFYYRKLQLLENLTALRFNRKVYKMPSWPALKSFGLPAMLTFWARTGKSACFHFGPLVLQEKEEQQGSLCASSSSGLRRPTTAF